MEKLYHHIWKTRLKGPKFRDSDGRSIEVVDPGVHNTDSGPDFFNSKILIDGIKWIGNVEIHVKASDWFRHGHDKDPAYDNVILHVVAVSDKRIPGKDGSLIPQIELTFGEDFYKTVGILSETTDEIRCASMLRSLTSLQSSDWFESLTVERLQQKTSRVMSLRESTTGDWEQTCFILFARGLGFGLNGEPFEMLAKSLPLRILHHHSDNIMQIEALIFGQAGMLDSTYHIFDEYYQMLCREYYFLARKYGLRPMRPGLWKYSRTRPQNFPHRRLSLLAASAKDGFSLFTKLCSSSQSIDDIINVFNFKSEGYWKEHYSFDTEARPSPVELSRASKILLIINVAIPLLYAYASTIGDIELGERAVNMLADLPPENNSVVRQWKMLGFESEDAARSQALLHLRKEYCDRNKCMYCRFGHQFLRTSI